MSRGLARYLRQSVVAGIAILLAGGCASGSRGQAEEPPGLAREAAIVQAELAKADEAYQQAKHQAEDADREAEAIKARLAEAEAALADAETTRTERVRENTDAQVAFSRVNERLAGLTKKRAELDTELRQRRIDAVNLASADRSAASSEAARSIGSSPAAAVRWRSQASISRRKASS